MTYNIPSDLLPYLEYIPEEMMSDIITDALRALIFKKPEVAKEFDMSQIVEQLRGLSVVPTDSQPQVVQESEPEKLSIVDVNEDEDIPDELKDIVGDFTANLFK